MPRAALGLAGERDDRASRLVDARSCARGAAHASMCDTSCRERQQACQDPRPQTRGGGQIVQRIPLERGAQSAHLVGAAQAECQVGIQHAGQVRIQQRQGGLNEDLGWRAVGPIQPGTQFAIDGSVGGHLLGAGRARRDLGGDLKLALARRKSAQPAFTYVGGMEARESSVAV